jgi:xanthine phosphoribosyltransferase
MTDAKEHIPVSWAEIQRDAALLAARLALLGPWRGIVAIARGGLVPAALVSRALEIRMIETVSVAMYEKDRLITPELLKPPEAAGAGEGWLVIDDLVDRGFTMRAVRALLPRAHVGVLYAKPEGRPLADTHIRDFAQDCWIDFPWEMDFLG